MTLFEAVDTLIWEAKRSRLTKLGYTSVVKAMKDLPLTDQERGQILSELEYADATGKPYPWLTEKRK